MYASIRKDRIHNYGTLSSAESDIPLCHIENKTCLQTILCCQACSGIGLTAISAIPYMASATLSASIITILSPLTCALGMISSLGACCLQLNLLSNESQEDIPIKDTRTISTNHDLTKSTDGSSGDRQCHPNPFTNEKRTKSYT